MKKLRLLSLVSALFMNTHLIAQTCPNGPFGTGAVFSTQGQIDSFSMLYPECTQMQSVHIIGEISNLQGLSGIVELQSLSIYNTTALTNLEGLNNLAFLSTLNLYKNMKLVDLHGLESLQSLENLYISDNPVLQFLDGLENLTTVSDNLVVLDNPSLSGVGGLSGLTLVNKDLIIEQNGVENLNGIENLFTVGRDFMIQDNEELTDISSLNHAMTINGQLKIRNNDLLADCAVQAVCDYINYVEDYANFQVYNNTGNCATVFTIEAACLAVGTTDLEPADVQIAPNPTTGLLTLTGLEGRVEEIEVVGAAGWRQKNWVGGNVLDLGGLPSGVYFVAIAIDGQLIMKRVVKI